MKKNEKENSNYEYEKEKYKSLIEQRNTIKQATLETSKLLDKSILTLSSSFLALTITFVNKLYGYINFTILFAILLCFLFSVISTIISLYTSQVAGMMQIKIIDEKYCQDYKDNDDDKCNICNIITGILNALSISLFILGVVLIVILIYLGKGENCYV